MYYQYAISAPRCDEIGGHLQEVQIIGQETK